jgi:hypothetical protein
MTMIPRKYTDRRLITHHHIAKAQLILPTGFLCRVEQRKLYKIKIKLTIGQWSRPP